MWSNIAVNLSDVGTCSSRIDGRRTFTLRTGGLLNRSNVKVTRPFIDELKEAALAARFMWHGQQHH